MNAVTSEEDKTTAAGAGAAGTAGKPPADLEKVLEAAAKEDAKYAGQAPDDVSSFVVPPADPSVLSGVSSVPASTPAPTPTSPANQKTENPKAERAPAPTPAAAATAASASAPQSKTGEELRKKEFPKPADFKPEKKALPNIPSKVKLADIQLPSYMKGVLSSPTPATPQVAPEVERSIREIGVGPQRPTQKTVVSIADDKKTEIDENGLPKIRTYAQDMSEEIRKRGATLSTIIGAEREREAERKARIDEQVSTARRRVGLVLGAALIIALGISIVVGVIILTKKQDTVAVVMSIVPENKKEMVVLEKDSLVNTLAKARAAAQLSLGDIERFVVTDGVGELTPEALLTKLGAPAELARNADRVMIGVHAFDHTQPFIIIETRYYDLAFGSMLAWEPKMAKTLGGFFTPATATGLPPELHFKDGVYKNVDLRTSETTWPILYAFPEEKLLVITTNPNTLSEILTRLSITKVR